MKTVPIQTAQGDYQVIIERGLTARIGALVRESFGSPRILIFTDSTVDGLYGDAVQESLNSAGFNSSRFVFPAGEASKTLNTAAAALESLAANRFTRGDLILALGGGVTGDLAGFTASVYQRGIRFIQAPTTLLAAVDSSVGGKTGVDLPQGKNLAGTFWQPSAVYCDPELFSTLSPERIADGYAEIIKHGFIYDADYLTLLEQLQHWDEQLETTIERSIRIKAAFVAADTHDRGERQKLNFGHTFGHAIETVTDFAVSHGAAVAMGMVMASRAADRLNISADPITGRLTALLKKYALPTEFPDLKHRLEPLARAAAGDKKSGAREITFVFPVRAGEVRLTPIDLAEIPKIFALAAEAHGERNIE